MTKRVLFISSVGGHLEQLLSLNLTMNEYEHTIVTEKNPATIHLKSKFESIYFMPYMVRKNVLNFLFNLFILSYKSIYLIIKVKPKVIVTTGTSCCIIICIIAKLVGIKTIYIESFARVHSATLTGKLCYKFVDVFIIQWKELKKIYPKALYLGSIY